MSILFQLPELSEYFFFIKRLLIYYCNKKISLKTKNKIFDESRRQEISFSLYSFARKSEFYRRWIAGGKRRDRLDFRSILARQLAHDSLLPAVFLIPEIPAMCTKARRRESSEYHANESARGISTPYNEERRRAELWTTDERKKKRERSVCKLSGYLQRCSSGPIVPQRHKSPLSGKLSAKRSPTTGLGELTHCAAHTYTDTASSAIRKHQRGHVPLWANNEAERERERERRR